MKQYKSKHRKPKPFTPKQNQLILNKKDKLKYIEYAKRWRDGESIPNLAKIEGVNCRTMHTSIAAAICEHRFSPEMREIKRSCNRIRRARGELPPIV